MIASFGGIKLSDTVDYNRKISRYGKVRNRFNNYLLSDGNSFRNWYLPDWENDALWKQQHDRLDKQDGGSSLRNRYPTPKSFRDYCFEKAEKNSERCDPSGGWCTECIWNREWDILAN